MKSFMIMGLCHMKPKRLVLTKSTKTIGFTEKKNFPIVTEVPKKEKVFCFRIGSFSAISLRPSNL